MARDLVWAGAGRLCACAALLAATEQTARAQDTGGERAGRADIASVRGTATFGLGHPAIGLSYGFAGEFWLSDSFGVGLSGAHLAQFDLVSSSTSWVLTPQLVYRGAATSGRSYALATLGAGFADVRRSEQGACSFGVDATGTRIVSICPPRLDGAYRGLSLDAKAGLILHPGRSPFELAPFLRFQAVHDVTGKHPLDFLIGLDLELGAGWR